MFNRIAAVVRSYNNPHVAKQVKNLLDCGIGRVVVVINAERDAGSTRSFLGDLVNSDGRVKILEINRGYTWSTALNRAVMAIQMKNVRRKAAGKDAFELVLNISVEALITRAHLMEMVAAIADTNVAVVGTTFQGRQDGNVTGLGSSYNHPRNTCMLIRLSAFGFGGGFIGLCDDRGGMEDLEFILRLRALADQKIVMLNLFVPLVLGKHYHQATKEEGERYAMDQIIGYWRSHFEAGTVERDRIESIISDMRLEA